MSYSFHSSGGGYWSENTGTDGIKATYGGVDIANLKYSSGLGYTQIMSGVANDDFRIGSGLSNTYSRIELTANGGIVTRAYTNSQIDFYAGTQHIGQFRGVTTNAPCIAIKEGSSSPATFSGYGLIYTKSDNNLYFRDGDGTEHTVAFV